MARKSPEQVVAEERQRVQQRIESMQRHLDSMIEAVTWNANDDEHDPEGVSTAYERAQTEGLLADAKAELEALDHAVDRIAQGTYNVCERCGRKISQERLAALPAATTCIRCANARR